MKVAVITPYFREPREIIVRCFESVAGQTLKADHFLIADSRRIITGLPVRHLWLDCDDGHRDYGNVARGLGATLAAAEGYDAIAFLDADNWYDPTHIEQCLAAVQPDTDYVIAQRRFCRPDGSVMPTPDEPGHVDTNCYFFLPGSYHCLPRWALMPQPMSCVGDRVFLSLLKGHGLNAARTSFPTVNYRCLFANLYRHIGEEPPANAKPQIDMAPMIAWWRGLDTRQREIATRMAGVGLQ